MLMTMKKAVCWMMVFAILVGLAGCAAEAAPGTTGPTEDVLQGIPETSFPGTEPPETTTPAATLAPETVPPETAPETTGPETTEPPATEPETTEPPETTAPPATEPETTAPPATEPKPTEPKPVPSGKVSFTSVSEAVSTTGYVNVRSGPGSSYKKVASLPTNYSLLRTGVGDNGWSRVIYGGKEAYVSTSYLLFEEECDYGPDELLEMYPLEQCGCENVVLTQSRYYSAGCESPASWYVRCQCGYRSYLDVPGSKPTGHPFVDGFCSECGAPDPDHPEGAKYLAERDMTNYVAIGQAAMKYINEYRLAEGSTELTWLPGMSEVAQYRSVQLTDNFAHDISDIKEAHNYYEYGYYFDATLYGDPPEYSYFDSGANESIGRGATGETIDDVGKHIADLFHRSSGHWANVGSSEYSYIGVGYTNGYVCVMVGRVNYG